jgi:hypothetical protein
MLSLLLVRFERARITTPPGIVPHFVFGRPIVPPEQCRLKTRALDLRLEGARESSISYLLNASKQPWWGLTAVIKITEFPRPFA